MSTRLDPSQSNYSPNVPMTKKPSTKADSSASSEQSVSSSTSEQTQATPTNGTEVHTSQQTQSKETPTNAAKEAVKSHTQTKDQFSKASQGNEKKAETKAPPQQATTTMRNNSKVVSLRPGQTITSKFFETAIKTAVCKRGDSVKLEISGEGTIAKSSAGGLIKKYIGVFAGLGLSFSKEDAGHVQIQFNATAGARAGIDLAGILKLGGRVSLDGEITLRFKSAEDASAWLTNFMHKLGEVASMNHPVFKVVPTPKQGEAPTVIVGASIAVGGEAAAKFAKTLGVDATAEFKRTNQVFLLPNGKKVMGTRGTYHGQVKVSGEIGGHKIEGQRDVTEYTQARDPIHTNNGTYRQTRYTVKIPAAAFKGPKEKVLSTINTLMSQAGAPALSPSKLESLYLSLVSEVDKLGVAGHLGLSIEFNSVKEGGGYRPLNTRLFFNIGVGGGAEKSANIRGIGAVKLAYQYDATASKVLQEKVSASSEAYVSQVYTGEISKEDWGKFEAANKPAIDLLVEKHRKSYPRGRVQEAYQETLQKTKSKAKADQAALEALKKIWKNTYVASKDVTADAITIYNHLQMGINVDGSVRWRVLPLPKAEQEVVGKLIEKYKDQPGQLAALKQQLKHWLGEGTLNMLQRALQQKSGGFWEGSDYSDNKSYKMLSPTETYKGNSISQLDENCRQIMERLPSNPSKISAADKAAILRILGFHKDSPETMAALKERLIKALGDKNMTKLQKALEDQVKGHHPLYTVLFSAQKPRYEDTVSTR
ncbi:MAG: hypothetical protein H6728_14970 [Myxococcales bacterium]|nr:hypothetical protein [Myxococcales bacterium]MCB9644372.1 hypothetical protein [Myxococcales bacterium]